MNQQQRPQLGQQELHELVTFQSFAAMQMQLALATRDQQVQQLSEQLAIAKKQLQEPVAPSPLPLDQVRRLLDYFDRGEPVAVAELNGLREALAKLRGRAA